jgi:agmatine/peptidylarginine deiminase
MVRITAENFITDDRTNKVYISSLIDKASGDLDAEVRGELKSCIMKFCPDTEILYNTNDVWTRDYMPIQLTEDVFLGYTYKPDYLEEYPECITNWQLHDVHTNKQLANNERFNFKVVQIPIILDGGNVIKAIVRGKPCFIMCNKVLEENNVSYEDFDNWWKQWWKDNFDGTEMEYVLLPWEGSGDNPIGHADGMVRFIEDGRVLFTNYEDYEGNNYPAELYVKKLSEVGFEVEKLSYRKLFDYKNDKLYRMLFDRFWCYINFLQVGNRILVPSLGYDKLDKEAKRQIDAAFNKKRHIADVELINADMTAIVENMNDKHNSGGALNCLTWTIKA